MVVTTDAKCSNQTLMTIKQTWWCHKPSQCRDSLSIESAKTNYKFKNYMYVKSVNDV